MEDVLSFGSAISACAHGHHWRFSLMLLDTKDADAVACNGAVDACAKVHVGINGDLLGGGFKYFFIFTPTWGRFPF